MNKKREYEQHQQKNQAKPNQFKSNKIDAMEFDIAFVQSLCLFVDYVQFRMELVCFVRIFPEMMRYYV